jgi:hypothetical protein
MMAVEVTLEPEVQASDPGGLFPHTVTTTQRGGYDVSRDGKKFLFPMPDQRSPAAPITVVVNWPATLQK